MVLLLTPWLLYNCCNWYLLATNHKGVVPGHQTQPCCTCWPPAEEVFPEKFSFFFLFSLILSLPFFLFFSKNIYFGTKFFRIFYIQFSESNAYFFLRTIRSALEIRRQARHLTWQFLSGRVRPTGSTLLSTGDWFAVNLPCYIIFWNGFWYSGNFLFSGAPHLFAL